ncbi:hypothetical protein ALON55S_00380 [Alishewanella longhuensis]
MINKTFLDKLLKSGVVVTSQTTGNDLSSGLAGMLKGKGGAALAGGALGYVSNNRQQS